MSDRRIAALRDIVARPTTDPNEREAARHARESIAGSPARESECKPDPRALCWRGFTAKGERVLCADCGASGVKFWRDYQAVLDAQTLRCKSCACTSEGKDPGSLSGDQIGWMVPAVPTSDGGSFWGYTSVPLAAVDWWQALPVE